MTPNYANKDDIENLTSEAFTASKKEKWYDGNSLFKNLIDVKNVKQGVYLDENEDKEYRKVYKQIDKKQKPAPQPWSRIKSIQSNKSDEFLMIRLIIVLLFSLLGMPLMENILLVIFRDEPKTPNRIENRSK
ncbi:MAG: hypothetical protein F6K22_28985 [Okeania sp. SIO2F4]|uniref:hypothetical protein n=1 Tax=Okeania sp. SIO2F4 TaxID=2607790 RepID=UPI00142C70C2|nr:hypothetical protein [Okeania sp. SIO2F4]NES06496.1 hypothetical protein [Okeania sp. SIO2F4]